MFARLSLGLSGLCLICCAAFAWAEDFHIESSVYAGKETKPASQNTTIFRAGIVYDYLSDKTVAVYDKNRSRFLLLDPARRVKTEVKTDDLQRFCDDLQERAAKEGNSYVRFMAHPQFETKIDDKTGELVMKSPQMTYRVSALKAESDKAASQYRDFSDWYARLNAMTNHFPPFPRMALNEELFNRGLVATEVQLTIPQQTPLMGRNVSLHSDHQVSWKLLKDDLDKINQTETQIAAFKAVSLEEFQKVMMLGKR